jgi:two-component system chemotaxis response regulator CheY
LIVDRKETAPAPLRTDTIAIGGCRLNDHSKNTGEVFPMGNSLDRAEYLGKHALVVDESRAVRTVARCILERNHFDVSEADDPEHGMSLWNQWKPHLVLANWYANGAHWFFETIRKHPSHSTTRLVAFLVENEPSEIQSAILAGADSVLLKPFTRETLEAMLGDVGLLASGSAAGTQLAPQRRGIASNHHARAS